MAKTHSFALTGSGLTTCNALQAPGALSSAGGVGFSEQFNRPGARNLLQSDGGHHRQLHTDVIHPLLAPYMK